MIHDDGRGLGNAAAGDGHLGLRGMRERMEEAGGSLQIESAPGDGTRVTATLPGGGV